MADLVSPEDEVEPRWWTVTVTQADGTVVEGLRMDEDTFTIRLMDQDERLWAFSKTDIRSYDRMENSTMPNYEETLTAGEIDDLVAYLFSLRKESSQ
jgi:putative heme-binding domain-containing protein